ncbi:MAG: potassium channel family protein [Actinomycetota bacterium]|nr:potassium channel family protein [Actinomycetota bacterium]
MIVLAVVVGVVLIAVTTTDLLLTVLHPTRRGPLSQSTMKVIWRVSLTAAGRLHREAIVGFAAPTMMLAQLAGWVLGLWLGFGLVFAGYPDQLSSLPRGSTLVQALPEALYLSGASLTTVGFGDLVAENDVLQLLTVAEAGAGLAVFGAAIAYVLAVYPRVSEIRVMAGELACVRNDHEAAQLVANGGLSRLQALHHDLIQLDESTQRFPILYYFHTRDPEASLATAMHAASLITLQLRFATATEVLPTARWHGVLLDSAVTRVIEHFRHRYHPDGDSNSDWGPDDAEIDRRLRDLRRAATDVTGASAEDAPDRAALAGLLGRSHIFLTELERWHLYPHHPM